MCVVWLNWWYFSAVFQFLIIVICIVSCLQNIMTLLTKHWLLSTITNFSVRHARASCFQLKKKIKDPEGEVIAISAIELSFLWVKIVTPCGFVQWPKMWFLLLNWWRITTCKRVHWDKNWFLFCLQLQSIQACEQSSRKAFHNLIYRFRFSFLLGTVCRTFS